MEFLVLVGVLAVLDLLAVTLGSDGRDTLVDRHLRALDAFPGGDIDLYGDLFRMEMRAFERALAQAAAINAPMSPPASAKESILRKGVPAVPAGERAA